ncbi:lysophospholipase [Talaromyces proteolyticus]|uniref:Lysophospholipase n=1 Tax=Talaromyces proteolyticus TaxID=1131652 RepID=A0AAD4KRX2_9EURO|nr:lysophospholipase [Talaromyces proteolyticus]KAH8695192.1 lysophospholipase [Talaromyces proteolyticus]
MFSSRVFLTSLSLFLTVGLANFAAVEASTNAYAPVTTTCPTTTLLRSATGLNSEEAQYRENRKKLADGALKRWLSKTSTGFQTEDVELPTIALATSGGSYRALLTGAGIIQALDERDSNVSTSGLFQAITYQSGLSGGSWLLPSFAGNNWPTITLLKDSFWLDSFSNGLLAPQNLSLVDVYNQVIQDLLAKSAAGYEPTLTDSWGRLLSYQLFPGPDYGRGLEMSALVSLSNFTNCMVPFPIITALGVKTWEGQCMPGPNATQYEFTPIEFGSWDNDVSGFADLKYLGTSMSDGKPVAEDKCTTNFDNLGFVLGTSSNLFNYLCVSAPQNAYDFLTPEIISTLEDLLDDVHQQTFRDEYAVYPNPFRNWNSSTGIFNDANPVSNQEELYIVDGGDALQSNPIWPMLQPERGVDVLLVNDNAADTKTNYPNGSEILMTYVESFNQNLTRMPYIPSMEIFLDEGLNTRATFFGCDDADKITIVYLPNYNFTYPSGQWTYKLEYTRDETNGMINNGMAVATQNDTDEGWGTCIGCAIMGKAGAGLPAECDACFQKYCYRS